MQKIAGKITLASGSIAPIIGDIWAQAGLRLSEAQQGLVDMRDASNQLEYQFGWTKFVDSVEAFWTNLYSVGKNNFTAFKPWIAKYEGQRSNDQLLQYLRQARHQSQHGGNPLNWDEGHVEIGGPKFSGTVSELSIWQTGDFTAQINSSSGTGQFQLIHHPPKPALRAILNTREKREYPPPTIHLDRPVEKQSPEFAALLGLRYYEDVFRAARNTFILGLVQEKRG